MLETITSIALILNASAISLGVGSSTLAITSFLVALNDKKIDASERRMLGVIYILLRIAMIMILLTTLFIVWQRPTLFGNQTPFLFTLIVVLYINAFCMTKHWISMKIGPALQAATWYTLGFIVSIHMFALYIITTNSFIALYLIDMIIALAVLQYFLRGAKK